MNLPPPLGSGGTARIYNMCTTPASTGAGTGSICTPVTYSFSARFTPHFAGSAACDVVISTSSGSGSATAKIHLTGSGSGASYGMAVGPPAIDFGDVAVGAPASATQDVTIKNTGTASFTYQPTLSGAGSAAFVVTQSLNSMTLAGGLSSIYSVACQPPAIGTYSAALEFTAQTTIGPLSGHTNLTCRGVTTTMTVSPNPINFGALLSGAPAKTNTVTIKNLTSATVVLTGFGFAAGSSPELSLPGAPGSMTLPAGTGSATVDVTYTPVNPQTTGPLGRFVFTVDGTTDQNVPIVGGAEPGSISTNPASIDFGPVCADGSASKAVAVFANAAGTVTLMSRTGPSSPFTVTPELFPPGTQLMGNHGNEVTLTVHLPPTSQGELSDTLHLVTDIPGQGSARDIAVLAHVIPSGIAPTPSELRFGAVAVGESSPPRPVMVTNCGAMPMAIMGARVDGPDLREFQAVPFQPVTLQHAESATVLVLMSPHSNGAKIARLLVDTDVGEPISIPIDGTAFSGSDSGTAGDRETYYACSTSRPGMLWPIAFALLLLRRRRR